MIRTGLFFPRFSRFLLTALVLSVFVYILSPASGEVSFSSSWVLPLDFSPARQPNPAAFTETSYEDESIRVRLETREADGIIWRVAFVEIASPTQLRTATANSENLLSRRTASVQKMAAAANAVVAINGDFYMNDPREASVEYRMTQKIRYKAYRKKDVLLIDSKGDFHLIQPLGRQTNTEQLEILSDAFSSWDVVNAFTFGPALVVDGQVQTINPRYAYTPNRKDPRSAVGQTGPLSYVLVLAEGRGESTGATMQELADFMGSLGCLQAYNLDGGNSAQLVFGSSAYKGQKDASDRGLNDILYFGSAVPEESWRHEKDGI